VFVAGMKCDDVQFAFVASGGSRTNPDIATDKIATKLVPFRN